jgi:hypothetical protein
MLTVNKDPVHSAVRQSPRDIGSRNGLPDAPCLISVVQDLLQSVCLYHRHGFGLVAIDIDIDVFVSGNHQVSEMSVSQRITPLYTPP